jgi:hypothetical protein
MFILVRARYELVLSSIKLYRSAILPSSAFRAHGNVSPVFQAGLDCEIQPGSIGAGLTARYDFAPFVAHPSTVIGFRRGIILIPFRYVNCSGIINFLDQVLDLSTQGEKTFSPSSPKAVSPSSFS